MVLKMKLKKVIGKIHLYIGLVIGVLFFVIAFSGAIYTWAPEISTLIYDQKVEPKDQSFISVADLRSIISKEFPQGDFRTAFYKDKAHAIQILLYGQGTYYNAWINPYTGEWIRLQDMNKGWLNYLRALHRNLLLGDVGREIVHWVTLMFLVMMVTGLVIWWPMNKATRRQSFTIQKSSSGKKLNYDLHNVTGFYVTWISIFTVITGLFWGFEIVKDSLKGMTGERNITYEKPESDVEGYFEEFDQNALVDSLLQSFLTKYPNDFVRVSIPHKKTDPIHVNVIQADMKSYTTDHYFYDRYTGKPLLGDFELGRHTEASLFHILHMMNYDIHFGTILGLPGRILAFLASLVAALLPVTGFLIWYGKWKRKGNKD